MLLIAAITATRGRNAGDMPDPAHYLPIAAVAVTPTIVLCACGAANGVLSILIYKFVSPQERIAHVLTASAQLQAQIKCYDGDLAGMIRLSWKNVVLACRRVWLAFIPSLLAGLPVLASMAWLASDIDDSAREWIHVGPAWVRSWMAVFVLALSVSAMATRIGLRVR